MLMLVSAFAHHCSPASHLRLTLTHPALPKKRPCSFFRTETDFVQVGIQVKEPNAMLAVGVREVYAPDLQQWDQLRPHKQWSAVHPIDAIVPLDLFFPSLSTTRTSLNSSEYLDYPLRPIEQFRLSRGSSITIGQRRVSLGAKSPVFRNKQQKHGFLFSLPHSDPVLLYRHLTRAQIQGKLSELISVCKAPHILIRIGALYKEFFI
jgi:hypothetical protein